MEDDLNNSSIITDAFFEQIRKDSLINDLNLREECRTIVNRNQKYIEEYHKLDRKLKKMDVYLKKVEGELFYHYRNEFEIKLTSSQDIMKFVQKDSKYQKALKIHSELKCAVDFLDKTIKNMGNNAWLVQKLVDLEKINQ